MHLGTVGRTTLATWIARLAVIPGQILALRIVGQSQGMEGLSVFVVVIGLSPWFALADLGLGQALQNRVAAARATGHDYHPLIRRCLLVTILLALVLLPSWWIFSINFGQMILGPHLAEPGKLALLVGGTLFIATSLGGVGYRIWFGEQRGWLAQLWIGGGVLAGTACLAVLAWTCHVGTASLVFAFFAPGALAACLSLHHKSPSPTTESSPAFSTGLFREAGGLWLFAILAALVLAIDYLLLPRWVQPEELTAYGVSQKIFSFLILLYGAVLAAAAPLMSAAFAKRDGNALRKLLRRTLLAGGVGGAVVGAALAITLPWLAQLVSGQKLHIPTTLVILLPIYALIRIWTDTFALALQAIGHVRPLLLAVSIQACITVAIQPALIQWGGSPGILLALIISFMATVAWYLPYALSKHLARAGATPCLAAP